MASEAKRAKASAKLIESSPDLIMEVESIAGDSDSGRQVESIVSESISCETGIVDEDIYAAETYYDDALEDASESGTESEGEQSIISTVGILNTNDRPQKFTIKLLHDWCVTNNLNVDLSTIKPEAFDKILCRFYPEVRSKSGQRYSRNTIMAIRYGLNRHFGNMEPPRKIDIIDGDAFRDSNKVFKTVARNAARENPDRTSPRISSGDLRKMYNSSAFSPFAPLTLLFKVWFEISVYFNRRRSRLQRDTKITDFIFDVDNDGRRFATEAVKNDKNAKLRMYEKLGDKMCPVASLERLLTKIDPNCQYLFQRPRQVVRDETSIWYFPERIGRNYGSQMMGKISKLAQLDNKYTNVSLKKLSVWSLEELVFQHRHLVKGDGHSQASLMQQDKGTPLKMDGQSTTASYSTSGVSRAILPVPSTKSVACNTAEHCGAFRPYVRKRGQANSEKKAGPDLIDVNTAKAKVKRIFQRLEYSDLVILVDWLKRIDVLKDTEGTVFCRESCQKVVAKPEPPRRFIPRQIQPLQPRQPTPYILPSPLSLSNYLMNSAVNSATSDVRPAAIYLPSYPLTSQAQTGVSLSTVDTSQERRIARTQAPVGSVNDGSLQTYPGMLDTSCPAFRVRQPLPIVPRRQNMLIPSSTSSSFQVSTMAPSQTIGSTYVAIEGTDSTLSSRVAVNTKNTEETSSQEKLTITQISGESKVWKIL